LDLEEDPPPYYDDLVDKQSPASGLPPQQQRHSPPPAKYSPPTQPQPTASSSNHLPPERRQQPPPLLITPEHIRRPRGEYIPLNPDIDKAHPPRWPAISAAAASEPHWVADPFNVSDEEAPPVPAEELSPSHIFASVGDIHEAIRRRGDDEAIDQRQQHPLSSSSDGEGDGEEEGDARSIVDDELPDPGDLRLRGEEKAVVKSPTGSTTTRTTISPTSIVSSPYGTYSKVMKKPAGCGGGKGSTAEKIKSPLAAPPTTDLDAVAIGALDYEQLMNYFEGLKESAA
jgi:hypothetical protein